LTRKFSKPAVFIGLKKTRKVVNAMRTYHVRLFIPMIYEIQARDEAQALEKVGELYKELYKNDLGTWIEPEIQPGDAA
jgi:hypothetical protein